MTTMTVTSFCQSGQILCETFSVLLFTVADGSHVHFHWECGLDVSYETEDVLFPGFVFILGCCLSTVIVFDAAVGGDFKIGIGGKDFSEYFVHFMRCWSPCLAKVQEMFGKSLSSLRDWREVCRSSHHFSITTSVDQDCVSV